MSEDEEIHCPNCGSESECDHLLVVIDTIYRAADAGPLQDDFNTVLKFLTNLDAGGENKVDHFLSLKDEIAALSDQVESMTIESGPGWSTTYLYYFLRHPDQIEKNASIFRDRHKDAFEEEDADM